MQQKLQRIAFDARYLSHGLIGGVHTYTLNLLASMLGLDSAFAFDIWVDDKAPFEIASIPLSSRIQTMQHRGAVSSIRNDLRIGSAMSARGANLAHFPANIGLTPRGLPTVITLHDAINLLPLREIIAGHRKDPGVVAAMTYLHLVSTRSIARRPVVVTVSEYSKREILQHSRLQPDDIHVVPSAPDDAFRTLPVHTVQSIRRRYDLREFVLLADAIKNPSAALAALRMLSEDLRSRTSLVFFSRRIPEMSVRAASESGECRLILQPSREELVELYNAADLLIFPSLYEGFGLPVIEAMKCGTPVISSDRGSLREVVGPGGVLVRPDDHAGIAAAIAELFKQPFYRRELRERALRHAARFSWRATAQATLGVYEAALRRAERPVIDSMRQRTAQ